jgi:putative FmdB family regulatory protein
LPTYEYHCDSCDRNFDVVQSFHDEPLSACPTCGSPVKKVFGNVGIVFKGSGFYKTDSRNGSSKAATAGSTTEGSGDTASASGSDAAGGGSTSSEGSSAAKELKKEPKKESSTPSSTGTPSTS